MARKIRPYLFYDQTTSICSQCMMRIEAKILIRENNVILEKWCPRHGRERVLIADDADYYRAARERFMKPPELPQRFSTPMRWGCPYDCGLCPDHMQHACLSIVEINDHCNLECPICYAGSGPDRTGQKSLREIEAMFQAIVGAEGKPDIVQISGGEPTLHPEFFTILDRARAHPFKHLMLNTNGLKIGSDIDFTNRLAEYMPGFEVYLQFDSLKDENLKILRGASLVSSRLRALEHLNRLNISTTLVVTLMKGVNDHEIGEIIDFALQYDCVRGVTLQPVQHAGRADGYNPSVHRLTLTETRRQIHRQSHVFNPQDIVPVPCNPDCLAMGYALRHNGSITPLSGLIDPEWLLQGPENTIVFENQPALREKLGALFSSGHSPQSGGHALGEFLCCLPQLEIPRSLNYSNVFRVLIMQFLDVESFDVRVAKKSCVQFARPDGKLIPFDTYNLFYRDGLQSGLAKIRTRLDSFHEVMP